MNKVFSIRRVILICFSILFFTVLIPLPGVNKAYAASNSSEEKLSEIKLNVKKKLLVVDTSYTLVLYNTNDSQRVSFKSSDSDIASVSNVGNKGIVTANKVGDVTITATVKSGIRTVATLTCSITVGPPAIDIKFKGTEITLTVDSSTNLEAILKPNNTVEEILFTSKDPSIVSVSSSGRITAKSVGSTYVFGSIGNGKYDMILVKVVEEPSSSASKTKTQQK